MFMEFIEHVFTVFHRYPTTPALFGVLGALGVVMLGASKAIAYIIENRVGVKRILYKLLTSIWSWLLVTGVFFAIDFYLNGN